jgi:prepilin-type N-terminal cleavage/methylation domain-containing protein
MNGKGGSPMTRQALGRVGRRPRRNVLKNARKNSQEGFTLIELLVVVSILGILAAIVTMSLVGITNAAQHRAAATELQTVQTAYDTMLADQQVPNGHECDSGGSGSRDMTSWPDGPSDSSNPHGQPVPLAPNYLRQNQTHGTYRCTGHGQIVQDGYSSS